MKLNKYRVHQYVKIRSFDNKYLIAFLILNSIFLIFSSHNYFSNESPPFNYLNLHIILLLNYNPPGDGIFIITSTLSIHLSRGHHQTGTLFQKVIRLQEFQNVRIHENLLLKQRACQSIDPLSKPIYYLKTRNYALMFRKHIIV